MRTINSRSENLIYTQSRKCLSTTSEIDIENRTWEGYVGPYWFVQDDFGVRVIAHRCALADADKYGTSSRTHTATTISGNVGEQDALGPDSPPSYVKPNTRNGPVDASCSTSKDGHYQSNRSLHRG